MENKDKVAKPFSVSINVGRGILDSRIISVEWSFNRDFFLDKNPTHVLISEQSDVEAHAQNFNNNVNGRRYLVPVSKMTKLLRVPSSGRHRLRIFAFDLSNKWNLAKASLCLNKNNAGCYTKEASEIFFQEIGLKVCNYEEKYFSISDRVFFKRPGTEFENVIWNYLAWPNKERFDKRLVSELYLPKAIVSGLLKLPLFIIWQLVKLVCSVIYAAYLIVAPGVIFFFGYCPKKPKDIIKKYFAVLFKDDDDPADVRYQARDEYGEHRKKRLEWYWHLPENRATDEASKKILLSPFGWMFLLFFLFMALSPLIFLLSGDIKDLREFMDFSFNIIVNWFWISLFFGKMNDRAEKANSNRSKSLTEIGEKVANVMMSISAWSMIFYGLVFWKLHGQYFIPKIQVGDFFIWAFILMVTVISAVVSARWIYEKFLKKLVKRLFPKIEKVKKPAKLKAEKTKKPKQTKEAKKRLALAVTLSANKKERPKNPIGRSIFRKLIIDKTKSGAKETLKDGK
jgi:hypothetical protein